MPFPSHKRVIYNKNPLAQVICQLRFPPILSINSKDPSDFQDAIREHYPLYEEQLEHVHQITLKPDDSKSSFPQVTQASINKNHRFSTADNLWHINLTRTFISISTSKYERWEDFLDKFGKPYDEFMKNYKPVFFFDRVGLRYIDVFCRSEFGLEGQQWSDLINPYALGPLSAEPTISDKIRLNNTTTEIVLSDEKSIVKVSTSLGNSPDKDNREECFIVDSDFYSLGRHSKEDVFSKLDYLHERAGRLIRWIITDKLHEAMEPREL